jgi:hypothetical protein
MRLLATALVWAVASAVALAIAWKTKVGPVLFVLSSRHGVHLGDIVAFFVAFVWAGIITMALLGSPARN